jgi:hypothetical protein
VDVKLRFLYVTFFDVHEQFQYHDFLSDDVVLTQEHEVLVVPTAHDYVVLVVFVVVLVTTKAELATQQ